MHKQYFWPVSAVLLGVIILMINLGYLPRAVMMYWPVLLVLWGLMKIADSDVSMKKGK